MLPSLENIALFRGIAPGDAEALTKPSMNW